MKLFYKTKLFITIKLLKVVKFLQNKKTYSIILSCKKYFLFINLIYYMKTKIKKIAAFLSLSFILANNSYAATQIGTWTVTWDSSFDTAIMWNDTIPWEASWTINWIVIKAQVLPILNMVISAWVIDLWILNPSNYASWSIDMEVGTNAANWVTVSAKSTNAWLLSASTNSTINSLNTDWIAKSYKFSSSLWASADSAIAWYTRSADLDVEVNDNTTSHILYTTNKSESSTNVDDFKFTVSAKIDAQTPAANDYQDLVSVTVVWNF